MGDGCAVLREAYIKASNADRGDGFGSSLALDGNTLVVGAPNEDSGAVGTLGEQQNNTAGDAGAVYVFVRSEGMWTQEAYLKASNTDARDQFGFSTAARDVVYPLIITECFGLRNMAPIYGALMVALLPGATIGPVFAAVVYDNLQSYELAFVTFFVLSATGLTGLFFLRDERARAPSPSG